MNILIEGFYPSIADYINIEGKGTKIESVPCNTSLVPITIPIIFLHLVNHLALALHIYGTGRIESSQVGKSQVQLLPPKVLLDYLQTMITIPSNPIHPYIAGKTTSPLKI